MRIFSFKLVYIGPLGLVLVLVVLLLVDTQVAPISGFLKPPSLERVQPSEVERVNRLVWCRFGKDVTFSDERLRVINFTMVPVSQSCSNARFLVIVNSKTYDVARRMQLRSTYGHAVVQKEFNFRILFVLGLSGTKAGDELIEQEAFLYDDIVQANFLDSYRNLTVKTIAAMRYVAGVCTNVRAVLKIDDNVEWNVISTSSLVDTAIATESIHCSVQSSITPARDPASEWYVSKEEFPNDFYSTYCYGFAYIIPLTVLSSMLDATKTEQFIHLDNVFFTGQLAKKSGVKHVDIMDRISFFGHSRQLSPDPLFIVVNNSRAMDFFVLANANWFLQRFLNGDWN